MYNLILLCKLPIHFSSEAQLELLSLQLQAIASSYLNPI